MSFEEKKKIIMRRGYCFVCLKFGHRSAKCKLKLKCPVCEKRHYAILCPNLPNKSNSSVPTKQDCTSNSSKDNALSNQACCSEVLLQSLMVKLRGRGTERVVRALCDSGSQKSYITQKAAASMGYECLGKEKMVHCLFGGTESPRKTHNRYLACVSNLDNTYECKIAVLDQPKICGEIRKIPKGVWLTELEEYEITLTDTNKLQSESTEIEILLGADVIGKLLTGRLHKLKCGPVAIETNLGWTLMGKIPIISRKSEDNTLLVTSLFAKNNDIANLWELDIIGITDPVESKSRTEMQKETMSHFLRTVKRDTDGRYQVALPWIEGHATLSSNHQLAEKRLKSSLKKMTKEGTVGAYQTVLDNWLNENIIEEVSPESHSSLCHYLPHRPVIKETSETTKIRPVFDASFHEKGSPSLNDCLLKGTNLIELIPSVVNRFRMGSIGVISDIEKVLLQEIWQLKVGWDEELPKELAKRFTSWVSQLDTLDSIKIPRWLNLDKSEEQDISMHVFCDASKNAYATCIYLRVETKDTTNVQLVQARSRVAPLKKMTILRLELMACCIGCRLAETVKSDMEKPHMKTYYWSDSTNALCWIRRETQWATFVRNRVKEILTLTEPEEWHHISGIDNPADLPSRGCTTKHLIKLRWWEGPDWLKLPEEKWPKSEEVPDEEIVIAEKRKTVISAPCMPKQYSWYYERLSSFVKIVRMIAWLKRFCCNARKASSERKLDELSTSEIEEAQIIIFCLVQQESFQGSGNKSIKPFKLIVDSRGILRLKTSLIFREDTADFRYPILLPANHPVVELLILWEHQTLSHAGVSVLMSTLRERFWILKSRKTIQKALRKCGRCRRFQAKRAEMDPAPLPESRVGDANIFEIVEIDLAGRLFLRGKIKGWIVLFTCAIYRAVHLELALSLSTEAFLQSLRRFIARRGRPSLIYTDNGTNFVGANSAFASLDWSSIISETLFQRIEWKFNPPTAAWWGGWWERLIRMVKTILRKVLGRACLGYEEVLTILCDTEQVINSRPLTYVSEEVEDLMPITPMMFLREISTSNVRDIDELNHVACNKRMRYEQKIRENLRKRFRSEYLGQLRQPMIGRNRSTPIRVGDIVLVGCDSQRSKRIDWPLANVLELYPGRDGLARVAKIKTRSGELVRPIQRLFPLELAMRETEREDPSRFLNKTDKLGTIKTPPQTRSGRTVIPPDKLCY